MTATFSGTLVVQSASNPHVKSEGEGLGGSIAFMNNNFKIGIRIKDNSGDLTVGDDLTLGSDGAILNFGADSDINITHVADTGLTTNGDFTVGDDLTISGGVVDVKNTGSQSVVRFYCESSNAHYTEIQAAAHSDYSGNVTVTLPVTAGTLATTATAADEATALAIALG